MDLNQLYFDHQVLLIRAQNAPTPGLRHRHNAEAARVADRIGRRQAMLGAAAAGARPACIAEQCA